MSIKKIVIPFSLNMMFPNYILGLDKKNVKKWINKMYGINKEVKK